jgi:hypothetical protein
VAFASCWDNYPDRLSVPVDDGGRGIYFLVAGTTTPMHTMLANGVVRVVYADGVTDHLDLVHPDNYLSLSNPYTHPRDAFPLADPPPERVRLGERLWANVLNLRLRPGVEVTRVELEALSEEIVIGLMGLTVMK